MNEVVKTVKIPYSDRNQIAIHTFYLYKRDQQKRERKVGKIATIKYLGISNVHYLANYSLVIHSIQLNVGEQEIDNK